MSLSSAAETPARTVSAPPCDINERVLHKLKFCRGHPTHGNLTILGLNGPKFINWTTARKRPKLALVPTRAFILPPARNLSGMRRVRLKSFISTMWNGQRLSGDLLFQSESPALTESYKRIWSYSRWVS